MGWQSVFELLAAGRQCGTELSALCVSTKSNPGLGGLYLQRPRTCRCISRRHRHSTEQRRPGTIRPQPFNVWSHPGLAAFGTELNASLALHPTVKPIALVADILRDTTKRGGFVIDTFIGSSTTIMAAEETGRRCFGVSSIPPTSTSPSAVAKKHRLRCEFTPNRRTVLRSTGSSCGVRSFMSGSDDDPVGYKHRKKTRFKKGRSGNPTGKARKNATPSRQTSAKNSTSSLPSPERTASCIA